LQMFYSKFGFVKTTEILPTMVRMADDWKNIYNSIRRTIRLSWKV
jgi:hypothetical protein